MAAAESVAMQRDVWNAAEIAHRLKEAGLVVIDSGRTVHRVGLEKEGQLLTVSRTPMEIYVYANAAARRADMAALDTTTNPRVVLGAPPPPRYVITNNLIVVLHTRNEELIERVSNALLARHLGGEELPM